jgi:hypothetical protein
MPLAAYLTCRQQGRVIEALSACPTLALAIESSQKRDGIVRIEVLDVLVLEDVYGEVYAPSPADVACWAGSKSRSVLFETDLGSADFTGQIGRWNLEFLQWLKGISEEACEMVEIEYEHERGDYLYEVAWWASDPSSGLGKIEVFGIQSHDGMVEPEWRREVIRHSDGRTEIRIDEWPKR